MQDRFVRGKERTGKDAVNGGRRALLLAALGLTTGYVRAEDDRVLRIGVDADYPPFTFYDDMRTFTGVDPVLAREACRRLGVTSEFIPIAWDRKDELFADKKIDCVWSCFSMTGREALYRWVAKSSLFRGGFQSFRGNLHSNDPNGINFQNLWHSWFFTGYFYVQRRHETSPSGKHRLVHRLIGRSPS